MFRRGLASLVMLVLIGVALLGAGGYAGWTQGFSAGVASASGGSVPGFVPYAVGFSPAFFAFAFFFKALFAVFLLFILFRVMGFIFWKGRGRHGHWEGNLRSRHDEWHRRQNEETGDDLGGRGGEPVNP